MQIIGLCNNNVKQTKQNKKQNPNQITLDPNNCSHGYSLHLTQKQKKFLKIMGATSSDMKFRSGRCDANGLICGDWTMLNGRSDSF